MCILLHCAVQPAKELLVYLCTDPQHHQLLTPQHIQLNAGRTTPASTAAAAAGAESSGFTTPTRKTPSGGASASKGSASSSSKKSKSSSKGSKQQRQDGGQEGSTAGAVSPAVQWQLQLLQKGLDWSKPRQRQLMQQLLHKQLLGSAFLAGMLVRLLSPFLCGPRYNLTLAWCLGLANVLLLDLVHAHVWSCQASCHYDGHLCQQCSHVLQVYVLYAVHNLRPEQPTAWHVCRVF